MSGRAAIAAAALVLFPAMARNAAAQQDWVPRQTAEIQVLDKVTARISVLRAAVGQSAQYGTLNILVRACNARPPGEVQDAAAFLETPDSRRAAGSQQAFRGWMFANAPGVSMLEHPVYDVRVLDCK